MYDPQDTNDRLLLGLKGTISEFELVTMRNRLERGRLHKARRGELFQHVPLGYVKVAPDSVDLDPDEQVRDVIRLVFDKYEEIGSVWGVFHYLARNNIRLGIRPFHGPNRGNLEWRRPTMVSVRQILVHPMYAGAYAFGRRPHERVRTATGSARRPGKWVPMERWKVLKHDCLPAYITWERYLANQERMRQHRWGPGFKGSPRNGPALLAGIWWIRSSCTSSATANMRVSRFAGKVSPGGTRSSVPSGPTSSSATWTSSWTGSRRPR